MSVRCEQVLADLTSEEGETRYLTIPAFTVTPEALRSRLSEIERDYFRRSADTGNLVSLGDFALYVLTLAADDPTTMED